MNIFTKSFAKVLAASGFLVLCAYSFPTRAGSEPKQTKFQYKLVMSEDDAVCKPLTELYNEMLTDEVSQAKITKRDILTNFEIREPWGPERFAKIGFLKPPEQKIKVPNPPGSFPEFFEGSIPVFDLFNEGKPRMILLGDQSIGNGLVTRIRIMKKDAEYRLVQQGPMEMKIDPDTIDRDVGYSGLADSQKNMQAHILGDHDYLLTKWPNFDALYNAYIEEKAHIAEYRANPSQLKWWFLPMISRSSVFISTRIFIHETKPYFILNQFTSHPGRDDSNVVVYQLTPEGHNDLCYITLPGEEASERQRANRGGQ